MKLNIHKYLSLTLLVLGIQILSNPIPERGKFVKDIPIKELKFSIPKVEPEDISNGVRVYSSFEDEFPIVEMEIHFYAGELNTQGFPQELVSVLSDSWKYGGSTNFPEEKLAGKIESLGAKISVSGGYDKITIGLSYLTRDEDEVLSLLKDFIQNPSFSEAAISNSKKKLTEMIHRRNERTESVGFRKAREVIFRKSIKGTPASIESLNSVSRDKILEFYKDMIKNRKKSIIISGKFDKKKTFDTFQSLLTVDEKYKSIYSEEQITEKVLRSNFQEYSKSRILVQKEVNQSMVILFGVLPPHNHPDFFAIQLLNYIIGGGGFNSYFMQKIREEKGLAYTAASYPVFEKDYGLIYFYTLTKNETLQEASAIMQQILSEETFQKITERELEDAKNSIINQFIFLFTNQHSILSNQLGFDEDEMPKNYLEIYRDKMRAVSLKDLQRVGRQYFDKNNLKSLFLSSPKNLEKIFPGEKAIEPEDSIKE